MMSVALAGALLLAACGGSGGKSSAGAPATTAASGGAPTSPASPADPNGVLKIAADFTTAGGLHLDPPQNINPVYIGMLYLIYGSPIRLGLTPGTYRPGLAQSYSVVDPSTFTMTLRPGLTFQDGEPYNAAAVKAGILRERSPKLLGLNQAFLAAISDIQVSGDTQLTLKFSSPVAGLSPNVFSRLEGMFPAPNDTNPSTNPIGAGPYKFGSYDQQTLELKKWDGYFDAASYKLAGVEYMQVTPGQPALNALQAGQVDMATINPPSVKALLGLGQYNVVHTDTEAFYYLAFCASEAPMDNLKVRQAIQAAVDRNALNETVQGGRAVLQVGMWPPGNSLADPNLPKPSAADATRAKQLVAQSGVANPSLTIVVQGNQPLQVQIAEVLQGQLANAGIKLSVLPSTNIATDFNNGTGVKGQLGETADTASGILKVTMIPGLRNTVLPNGCQYKDPEMDSLVNQITALAPDSPQAVPLWVQLQQRIYDQAYAVPIMTQSIDFGYNKSKVAGLQPGVSTLTVTSVANPNLDGVYIIKR